MLHYTNETPESYEAPNPAVDLYNMCKPIAPTGWSSTPEAEDISTPLPCDDSSSSDASYFTAFFFDYQHEMQLQQLQLLEQLMNPAVAGMENTPNAIPATTEAVDQSSIVFDPAKGGDFQRWLQTQDAVSEASTTFHDALDGNIPINTTQQPGVPVLQQTKAQGSVLGPPRLSPPVQNKAPQRYVCTECGKGFARASSLRTHRNIHTGDRPFTCPFKNCGKSFNARSNMLRHHKLHFRTDCGMYMLPNGETTRVKPSSRKLFALSRQQHQKYTTLPTI
ncbi:AGL207Wp [Eremothecium gossypii ATCC 10895]|uniref:AGL207Wp n=1 Tax=Eremothecium gossypii (strain ATCC 10895 / CBS 109.51 / FGSC 9923 / NRRL Y-1056) TaxID=284811 RepID=Q750Z4_EREGS|nr:AGL207Wp [Eremothecium gossypii ATCC 10895]AAS54284.1 AGL207Wp [Eremothecium gossypii ATCC 10895]AEY98610.1 FAGL207Wp [Eremothecium gossypii FDAG1]